jgi:hypothetical protein
LQSLLPLQMAWHELSLLMQTWPDVPMPLPVWQHWVDALQVPPGDTQLPPLLLPPLLELLLEPELLVLLPSSPLLPPPPPEPLLLHAASVPLPSTSATNIVPVMIPT